MVLCKFFLQGNCRFGENCKFEHQLNDGRQQHSSIIRQQNFGAAANTSSIDTNTLIRAVTNDMLAAEKGGQWLLSCYAPFKEKPNFPGFEEQSFEEVRWGHYEAQHNGTVEQYRQQLQMALQGAAMKIRSLQNPSPDAVNTIKTIYNSSQQNAAPNVFGNATGFSSPPTNSFGPSNFGNSNVFAQSNQQQNVGAKSIFAAANQKLFGVVQPQPSNSIFGNNQAIFANAQQGGSFSVSPSAPFGQPFANPNPFVAQPNQQAAAPFGVPQQQQQQPQPAPPAYGAQPFNNTQQNTSPFGMQQQTNSPLFSSQQNPSSPFAAPQQTESLPYGANQQPQFSSPFAAAQPNAPYGMQQQQSSFPAHQPQQGSAPFVASQEIVAPYGQPPNIFGGNANSAQALANPPFGSSNATVFGAGMGTAKDASIYSKLEDLSESDIKAYESDNFEFGKIPEKPPTIQMCF